jgi:transglutaminase-like putative cysteine protease
VLNRRKDGKDSNAGADASHAWVASYCPAHGWVAFDPTNGKIADTEFVTLGWGREYHDVSPLRGVVRGAAEQKLTVAVSVVPVESAANA